MALLGAGMIGALLAPAAPAAAETTVSGPDGDNVVTITVRVDCVGCDDWKSPKGRDVARYWEQTAEKAWKNAFDRYSYCNKYKFQIDIKMKTVPADAPAVDGRHRMSAGAPGSGYSGAGWDGVPERTPAGVPGQASPDGTRYYENDGDGAMPADATPTVIAHEFGHVIGLGDDRDAGGNAFNRGLMAGGSRNADGTVNTENSELPIGKNLVDRIGRQLEGLGKITCSQAWNGDVRGTIQTPGCAPVSQRGDIRIAVKEDGSLTGSGTTISGAYSCDNGASIPEMSNSYGITGTKTRGAFTLTFQDGVQLRAPIHGRRASGTQDTGAGTVTVTLRCRGDGCDEAAG